MQGDIIVNNLKNFPCFSENGDNYSNEDIADFEHLISNFYEPKKNDTFLLSNAFKDDFDNALQNKATSTFFCSTRLEFTKKDNARKLSYINSCKVRLCPMCAWRRSIKVYREARTVFDYLINEYDSSRFLFLTLTVKNVKGEDLQNEITALLKACNLLFKYKAIKKFTLGVMRSLEVTYNEKTNEFHPHLHCLVHTTYNSYCGRNYLTNSDFARLWQKALKINYIPVIDIRSFRPRDEKQKGRELAEMAKYSVKPSDYIKKDNPTLTKYLVRTLDAALSGRRLISYTGTFRTARKELLLRDDDENMADITSLKDDDDGEKIIYEWHFGHHKYIQKKI